MPNIINYNILRCICILGYYISEDGIIEMSFDQSKFDLDKSKFDLK